VKIEVKPSSYVWYKGRLIDDWDKSRIEKEYRWVHFLATGNDFSNVRFDVVHSFVISAMRNTGIDVDRYSRIFAEELLSGVEELEFIKPTGVQAFRYEFGIEGWHETPEIAVSNWLGHIAEYTKKDFLECMGKAMIALEEFYREKN
jgi:hypothetical protein